MVHMLCGGYGAARLYPLIDWDALGDPRIVCGFSDITALHLALAKHGPWITFYGPNFTALHAQEGRADATRRRTASTAPSSPSRSAACSRTRRTRTC